MAQPNSTPHPRKPRSKPLSIVELMECPAVIPQRQAHHHPEPKRQRTQPPESVGDSLRLAAGAAPIPPSHCTSSCRELARLRRALVATLNEYGANYVHIPENSDLGRAVLRAVEEGRSAL